MHLCFFTASEFYSFVVVVVVWYRTRRNGGPFFFGYSFLYLARSSDRNFHFCVVLGRGWKWKTHWPSASFIYFLFVPSFYRVFFFKDLGLILCCCFFLLLSLFIRSAFYRVVPLDVPLCYLWFVGYLVFFHINLFLVFLIHLTCFYRVFFRINLARLFNGTASASTW